jgi:hypothetical protein
MCLEPSTWLTCFLANIGGVSQLMWTQLKALLFVQGDTMDVLKGKDSRQLDSILLGLQAGSDDVSLRGQMDMHMHAIAQCWDLERA